MPKAVCNVCKRVWYGWVLKYKECYCCDVILKIEEK